MNFQGAAELTDPLPHSPNCSAALQQDVMVVRTPWPAANRSTIIILVARLIA
jgi:hypothetical protein